MAAIIIDIADAVAATLNAATLSQAFVAQRSYIPVHEIKDLVDLHVTVVPSEMDAALLDRQGRKLRSYMIDVGIQKVVGRGPMSNQDFNDGADPLMILSEEITNLFDRQHLAIAYDTINLLCTEVKNMPIYSPHHLDEQRVFTSVVRLTFKVGR